MEMYNISNINANKEIVASALVYMHVCVHIDIHICILNHSSSLWYQKTE